MASPDLSTARKRFPMAHMTSDKQLTALLQITTPDELNERNVLKFMANFDSVQSNDECEIVSVQASAKPFDASEMHASDDIYLRAPRKSLQTEPECLQLHEPVSTKGVEPLAWIAQLLQEVSRTVRTLFVQALALDDSIQSLLGSYPVSVVTLVSQIRFTAMVEQSLALGQLGPLTGRMEQVVRGLREQLKEDEQRFQYRGCKMQLSPCKAIHAAYYNTLNGTVAPGQRLVIIKGPHGTGKTQMQRDLIEVELGYKSVIAKTGQWGLGMVGGVDIFGPEEWLNKVNQAALANPEVWLIFEEANRLPLDVLNALLCNSASWARTVPTTFTLHPNRDGDWSGWKRMDELTIPDGTTVISMKKMDDPSDFEGVVEMQLASRGFSRGAQIAQSTMAYVSWCRNHFPKGLYDFESHTGMKKAILVTINQLSNSLRNGVAEEECMIRAVCTSMLPQLTPDDSRRAAEQLSLMFPKQKMDSLSMVRGLPANVHDELEFIAKQGGEAMQQKLGDFFLTAEMRHGIGVVTSEPHKTLNALSMCAAVIGRQLVYIGYGLCSDRMGISYLYGKRNKDGKWIDGVLTLAIRRAVKSEIPTWIVLDGPVNPNIMEPLHSLLDSRRNLFLPNDDSIKLTSNIRIIFLMDAKAASTLSAESRHRIGSVNMLPRADAEALQRLMSADADSETTLKRKDAALPRGASPSKRARLTESKVTRKQLMRMNSNEPKWTKHVDIDMCGQGDIKSIKDWKNRTTVEALKFIVEQNNYSAFTISSGTPSFSHAAIKKFEYQLTAAHCKPITSCCNHPCTIYIYHPRGRDDYTVDDSRADSKPVTQRDGSGPLPTVERSLRLAAASESLQTTTNKPNLVINTSDIRPTLGRRPSHKMFSPRLETSTTTNSTLTGASVEGDSVPLDSSENAEHIRGLSPPHTDECSTRAYGSTADKSAADLSEAITDLTKQLVTDTQSPPRNDEAGLWEQDSMPDFSLEDIEHLLSPLENAIQQAAEAEQVTRELLSSECETPVLQRCSKEQELPAGLQALDVRVQQMPQVRTTVSMMEPTNQEPPPMSPAPHVGSMYMPVQPMQMTQQQMQQFQIQQMQLQQMHMFQMQQARMQQAQMLRAQIMSGQLVGEDMYVGKSVVMIAGKYRGRKAVVECRLKQKYRLKVEGVDHSLEFYPKQFAIPQPNRR